MLQGTRQDTTRTTRYYKTVGVTGSGTTRYYQSLWGTTSGTRRYYEVIRVVLHITMQYYTRSKEQRVLL